MSTRMKRMHCTPWRGCALLAFALFALAIGGCKQEPAPQQQPIGGPQIPPGAVAIATQTPAPAATTPAEATKAAPASTPAATTQKAEAPAATHTVDVTLKEFTIDMPKTLPAGPTAFRTRNAGSLSHNLEIKGQGIDKKLPENLAPGEVQTLDVDLKPGAYHVFCPVGNHEARGMSLELTVTAK